MKKGLVLVLTSDIWAGIANLSIPDLMQTLASAFAIASSTVYLIFWVYDRFKKKP